MCPNIPLSSRSATMRIISLQTQTKLYVLKVDYRILQIASEFRIWLIYMLKSSLPPRPQPLQAHVDSLLPHLNLIVSTKTLFQNKVTFNSTHSK